MGRRPLDYAYLFRPVKSLDEIDDLAIVMLTSGVHIQIIDCVNDLSGNTLDVDLCQSSSGGPQTNEGVTIHAGGGDYLPVEQFRSALANQTYIGDYQQDNLGASVRVLSAQADDAAWGGARISRSGDISTEPGWRFAESSGRVGVYRNGHRGITEKTP